MSCLLPHRYGMGEVRWKFAPLRVNLDMMAIPLCTDKLSRHWSQGRLLPFDTHILGSTEVAPFHLHMNSLILIVDAASSVTQINHGTRSSFKKRTSFSK
ncbi:hypothetical protein TNCV_3269451 [Trichonephila clavipes]|nr:hypothetical protein TNCV_3269451 [Trichonephila clavipes]